MKLERYDAVFRASPDGIVVVDETGRIRDVNPMAEQLFGYSRAELVGEEIETLVPGRVRGVHTANRLRYMTSPTARPMGIGMELAALRRDGSEIPVEISLSPLDTAQGVLVIATVRDVTQRRQLRDFGAAALRASEAERKHIARELHDDTAHIRPRGAHRGDHRPEHAGWARFQPVIAPKTAETGSLRPAPPPEGPCSELP